MAQIFYFDSDPALLTSQLGAVNGVAQLDATGRLEYSQIPAGLTSGLEYAGTYDPATNLVNGTQLLATGALLAGTPQAAGVFVIVRSQGSPTPAVDGIVASLAPGSKLVSNGTAWEAVDDPEVITTEQLENGAVTTAKIGDSQVTTAKIADTNVTEAKIANLNVTTAKLADSAVTGIKIADDAVSSIKIANDAVTSNKIIANAVTEAKIATSAVTTDKIADNAVTNAKMADNSVNTAELVDNAVTTLKIVDNAVTNAKLADNAVNTAELVDSAVTAAKIADNAVTNAKLADNAVNTAEIADSAVSTAKIADNAITNAKMADNAVGTAEIADNAVTNAKLADNAVNTAEIADNAVTNAKLADNAVNTAEIADGAVTTDKLATLTSAFEMLSPYPHAIVTQILNGTGTETFVSALDTSDAGHRMIYRATKVSNAAQSTYGLYTQWRLPRTLQAWGTDHIQIRYRTSTANATNSGLSVNVYAGSSSVSTVATPVTGSTTSGAWATLNIDFTTPANIVPSLESRIAINMVLSVAGAGNTVEVGAITFNFTEKYDL